MAVDNVVNASSDLISTLIFDIGRMGLLIQALGLLVIFAVIFYIISIIIQTKRMKQVYEIRKDMERIERKINRIEEHVDKLLKKR